MQLHIVKEHCAVVGVDLDDTLALDENKPMIDRDLNPEILRIMARYVVYGYTVIIYTSRDISRKHETMMWLKHKNINKDIHYHDIVFNKMKYDILIDNAAINPACIRDFGQLVPWENKDVHRPNLTCEPPEVEEEGGDEQ